MKAQGPIQPGGVSPGRAPAQGQAPLADTACPLPPNFWGDHSFSFAFASKVVQQTSIYTADPKATNHQDPECPHRPGLSWPSLTHPVPWRDPLLTSAHTAGWDKTCGAGRQKVVAGFCLLFFVHLDLLVFDIPVIYLDIKCPTSQPSWFGSFSSLNISLQKVTKVQYR